jgi:PAS domain S-box-containing protein
MLNQNKTYETDWRNQITQNELILNAAGEGICGIDNNGEILFTNPAAKIILGWQDENLIGQKYQTILFGDVEGILDDLVFSPIQFALFDGESSQVSSETFCRKDRSKLLVEYICVPLKEMGEIIGAVITFQDISERSDIEAAVINARDSALESARTKMAFLANMSHEIRTPLNGIIGMSEFLVKTPLNEEQLHFAQVIKNNAEFLLQIVNEILDFSKIEAGKLKLENIKFDIKELMSGVFEFFKPEARKKQLNFNLNVSEYLPRYVLGDSNRLRQILNNLISNAIKFTKQGEIDISVEVISEEINPNSKIKFVIRDSGIGISKFNQDFVFESFVQADISTTRRFGGTGLGLSISKQLVSFMGGEIGFESEIAVGSTFWFTLNLEKYPNQTPLETTIHDSSAPNSNLIGFDKKNLIFSDANVLIAEDNEINQQVAVGLLKTFGIIVDIAKNGFEAIEMTKLRQYDLVFMDCQMPQLDGFEATKVIRQLESKDKKVPIIAMTASVLASEQQKCISSGMDDFLGKPFSANDLGAILIKYLKPQVKTLDSKASLVQHCLRDLIDKNTLENLIAIEKAGEPNFVLETLDLYFQQTDISLIEIKAQIQNRDFESLIRKAHLVRGSSGSIGFMEIFRLCGNLEQSAISQSWDFANENFLNIEAEYSKSKKLVAKLIDKLGKIDI